jgi:hypothetical protein
MNRTKKSMITITWILVSINIIAFLYFVVRFLTDIQGRHMDTMESGWTIILAALAIIVILLGILPMRLGKSSFSIGVSFFFAALPSLIVIGNFINNKVPSFKKEQTYAEMYYKEPAQRAIASAIETNNLSQLKQLVRGRDLNIQGNKVWDWPGLNYLQFAVRLRNSNLYTVDDTLNLAAIKMLIEAGAATTPALSEAITTLPPQTIALFLEHGANPNTHGYADGAVLLFSAIGTEKELNDIGILLIKNGANINAKNAYNQTPLMFAARNAGTSPLWNDAWRVVRYLLEEAHADYTWTRPDAASFPEVIRDIRKEAAQDNITMAPDFYAVVSWLKKHHVDTDPVAP